MPTDRPSELPFAKLRKICGRKQFAKDMTERMPSVKETKSCKHNDGLRQPFAARVETIFAWSPTVFRTLLVHTQSSNSFAHSAHPGSHVTPIGIKDARCLVVSQREMCRVVHSLERAALCDLSRIEESSRQMMQRHLRWTKTRPRSAVSRGPAATATGQVRPL